MKQTHVPQLVRDLARFGSLYCHFHLARHLEDHPRLRDDWIEALRFFLGVYAFERAGRAEAYAPTACRAIRKVAEEGADGVTGPRVWKAFCDLGGYVEGKGANRKNNPLCPDARRDAVSICRGLTEDRMNVYEFVRRMLGRGDAPTPHDKIDSVVGVGPKIASFFLRDVALSADVPSVVSISHLLQPIDIWVRRAIHALGGDAPTTSDVACAKRAVQLATDAGASPLLFNAGCWYFGSSVARSERALVEALTDESLLPRALEHERDLRDRGARLLAQADRVRDEFSPA